MQLTDVPAELTLINLDAMLRILVKVLRDSIHVVVAVCSCEGS
jgi:hypothetical protein